ncbi:MAG: hypothetical protein ABIJ86_00535 [Spirochaetota bacterium]
MAVGKPELTSLPVRFSVVVMEQESGHEAVGSGNAEPDSAGVAELQFFCIFSPQERYVVWAKDARTARAMCLQDTGREADVVLTGNPQVYGGMTVMASQKRLFGPFHLMTIVYSAWFLVIQPLTGFSLPFAVEPLSIMKGQIPAGLLFAAFQALYALSILAMLLLTGRSERYTNRTHLGLLNGLISSGLCGFFIAFTAVDGSANMNRGSLDAFAAGSFIFLAYLMLHVMVTGRLPGFRTAGPFAGLVRWLRNNPYSVELLSLASIPALWLNAEVSRGLFQFPLQLIRRDLVAGQIGLGMELGFIVLLMYGTIVFALLVYPSRTIGIHDLEHGRLHRVVQKKPPALKTFFLSYLGYLAALSVNMLYGFFLPV